MSKKIIALLIAIPVVVLVVLAFLLYRKNPEKNNPAYNQTKSKSQTSSQLSTQTQDSKPPQTNVRGDIPFPLSGPDIREVNVNFQKNLIRYDFIGKVKTIVATEAGSEIQLDSNTPDLPKFTIDKQTQFFQQQDTSFVNAESSALKPGQKIDITMDWDKENKAWYLRDIYIYN